MIFNRLRMSLLHLVFYCHIKRENTVRLPQWGRWIEEKCGDTSTRNE